MLRDKTQRNSTLKIKFARRQIETIRENRQIVKEEINSKIQFNQLLQFINGPMASGMFGNNFALAIQKSQLGL